MNKIKDNLAPSKIKSALSPSNIKESISDNYHSLESSIKRTVHYNQQFSSDDELIAHYEHDIRASVKALKYINSQTANLGKNHWKRVLKSNLRVTVLFLNLLGENSLHFDGIEEYYEVFDKIQAEQEIPMVHPKEKQFLIDSVYHELCNYLTSMNQVKQTVTAEADSFSSAIKLRVNDMVKYLKEILKLIKKRIKKKDEYERLHKKINKLMKKTSPLDEKEQKELNKLENKLKDANSIYTKLNDKLKAILPHAMSFLDEFIDTITKMILCKQLELVKEVDSALRYFSIFHGFTNQHESGDIIQSYDDIVDQWETSVTATRLQLESFITIIHNKKPDLLDEQIDDELKVLKGEQLWNKMTTKVVTLKHNVKPKDYQNGMFDEYLAADPLTSFVKFRNPNQNASETYHPSKIINAEDLHIPVNNSQPPPPLPPRSVTTMGKELPPRPLPATPTIINSPSVPPPLYRSVSSDSFDSVTSDASNDSDFSTNDDLSTASSLLLASSSPDAINKGLARIYNKSKNDIKIAPITLTDPVYNRIVPREVEVFNQHTSVSYKLNQFNKFFDKVLSQSKSTIERKVLTAKHDFNGVEPGDLSFKEGDQIQVIFDFQQVDTLYSKDQKNWIIGMSGCTNPRIGFVPSNYF